MSVVIGSNWELGQKSVRRGGSRQLSAGPSRERKQIAKLKQNYGWYWTLLRRIWVDRCPRPVITRIKITLGWELSNSSEGRFLDDGCRWVDFHLTFFLLRNTDAATNSWRWDRGPRPKSKSRKQIRFRTGPYQKIRPVWILRVNYWHFSVFL